MESNVTNVIVDANIWISYFDQDDIQYQAATKILNQYTTSGRHTLLLTEYILQEIITCFLYKNKPNLIHQLIQLMEHSPTIEILSVDHYFFSKILQFIERHHYKPKISLTDWSLLFLAQIFNCELLTFDKQLHNSYKKLQRTEFFS